MSNVTVICERCRRANATGMIFALCDLCQDEWFAEVNQREKDANGEIKITDAEVRYVHREFIKTNLIKMMVNARYGRIGS